MSMMISSGRFGSAPASKVLTYQGHAEDATDLTTYTFSSAAIGTASADRRVHVGVSASQGTRTIVSVTIGGVTATQNVQFQGGVATAAIYTANVPSGTTANIVVVWSGGQNRCGVTWWTSTGLASDTAVGTDSAVNLGDNTLATDMNVDVATVNAGFIIVYGFQHNSGGGGSVTYSPAAIVADGLVNLIEPNVVQYGAHGTTDGTTFDVRTTAMGTGNGNSPMVAASF